MGFGSTISKPRPTSGTFGASASPHPPATGAFGAVVASPSADNTTASVPAGVVSAVTTVTVTVRDQYNDLWTVGGDTVAGTVSGANTDTCAVVDNGNGTYTLTYTPASDGTDSIAITLNGSAISDSPYESEVAAS